MFPHRDPSIWWQHVLYTSVPPPPLPTLPPRKTEHLVLLGSTELFRIGKPDILGQGCWGCFFAWLGFIFMVLRYGVKNIPPSAYFWEAHASQCLGLSVCLPVCSLPRTIPISWTNSNPGTVTIPRRSPSFSWSPSSGWSSFLWMSRPPKGEYVHAPPIQPLSY